MEAMLKAVELIENALENNHSSSLKELWPQKPNRLELSHIPSPLYCDPDICSVSDPPLCLNLDEPTYGYPQIEIIELSNPSNPYHKDGIGAYSQWKSGRLVGPNPLIPKTEIHMPKCSHLDFCGGISPSSDDPDWLVFKIPKIKLGRIIVCFNQLEKKEKFEAVLPMLKFELSKHRINVAKTGRILWETCLELQKKHASYRNTLKEELYLGIYVNFLDIPFNPIITSVIAI